MLPPAQWGAVYAIRTGPWEFSRDLVARLRRRGWRCEDGRVLDGAGRVVDTPEEEDFFRACGVAYVPARARRG